MKTHTSLSAVALVLMLVVSPLAAHAHEVKPDDTVTFDLSAESWVSTKSARVVLNVEAAVSGNAAGTMRAAMTKAVGDVVKADWKLTAFNRMQDSTGMERWSASYEARLPENELNSLGEKAKGVSKAGMQLSVSQIDFSPTLDEVQATMAQLRTQIYKQTNDQLAALNTAMAGRTYRVASISFNGQVAPPFAMQEMVRMGKALNRGASMLASPASDSTSFQSTPMERSEKLTITAHIALAADTPSAASAK